MISFGLDILMFLMSSQIMGVFFLQKKGNVFCESFFKVGLHSLKSKRAGEKSDDDDVSHTHSHKNLASIGGKKHPMLVQNY